MDSFYFGTDPIPAGQEAVNVLSWSRILFPEFSLPLFLGAKSPYEPVDPSLTRLVRHQGV